MEDLHDEEFCYVVGQMHAASMMTDGSDKAEAAGIAEAVGLGLMVLDAGHGNIWKLVGDDGVQHPPKHGFTSRETAFAFWLGCGFAVRGGRVEIRYVVDPREDLKMLEDGIKEKTRSHMPKLRLVGESE